MIVLETDRLLLRHLSTDDALQWNHILRNVCQMVKVPRLPRREKSQTLTLEQARQLLSAASGDPLEALYVLALTTGMRQGELLALQWRDIDWKNHKIQVRRSLGAVPKKGLVISELKTVSSRRCIHLTDLAVVALQRHALRQQEERCGAGEDWTHQGLVFCTAQGKPLEKSNLLGRSFHPLFPIPLLALWSWGLVSGLLPTPQRFLGGTVRKRSSAMSLQKQESK